MTLVVRRVEYAPTMALVEADAAECRAGGLAPAAALRGSVEGSDAAWEMVDEDGRVVCVGGLRASSLLGGVADVWLLGSKGVRVNGRAFLRATKRATAEALAAYPTLQCWVHMQHRVARRWLEWLGFEATWAEGAFLLMQKERG